MDAITPLLCLAVGSAIPLLVIFVLIRRGMRQLAVAQAYGDVSRRLGLDVDTRGVSLHGHIGDQRIWVGDVMVGHGPDRRTMRWGVLDHERPLGLGLLLRRRGLSERLWRRARGPQVPLPGGLDSLLEASGDDPDRVRELLDEAVQEHLARTVRRWSNVVVTDTSVRVALPQPIARTQELQELVDDLRALSRALVQARAHVEPPEALVSAARGLAAVAEAHGLTFDPAYPAVTGVLEGRRLRIGAVRTADGYAAELRLGFRPHHTLGLLLAPQTEPDGYWSVGQDIQVGHPAFDDAFVVKGFDPEAVRELLSEEVCSALLSLHRAGRLQVDDVRLHLTRIPLDSDELERLIDHAIRAASTMGW